MKSLPVIFIPLLWFCGFTAFAQETRQPTVITSESLEMQGSEDKNFFYFRNDVLVEGTNLNLKCDELTVVAFREGGEDETVGEIGAIERIVARGDVEIQQAGRTAYAGRAEVDPRNGTVTLSESPKIVDNEVEVEGYQFVLHRGEKKFESIPDPDAQEGERNRSIVRLGALPDLGFDQDEEQIDMDDPIDSPTLREIGDVSDESVDEDDSQETSNDNNADSNSEEENEPDS